MVSRSLLALAVLAGCGRIAFDAGDQDAQPGGPPADDAAKGDGNPAACPYPGAIFCDGFESPTLDAWMTKDGSVARTTTRVHLGTAALMGTTDATLQQARVIGFVTPVDAGALHTRSWLYLPAGFTISKFNVLALSGPASGIILVADQGKLNLFNDGPPQNTLFSGVDAPRDRWFCFEVHIGISATTGSLAMDLDGTEIGTLTNANTLPTSGYNELQLGLVYLFPGQDATTTIFVDDVVVGTQPIGCS